MRRRGEKIEVERGKMREGREEEEMRGGGSGMRQGVVRLKEGKSLCIHMYMYLCEAG